MTLGKSVKSIMRMHIHNGKELTPNTQTPNTHTNKSTHNIQIHHINKQYTKENTNQHTHRGEWDTTRKNRGDGENRKHFL